MIESRINFENIDFNPLVRLSKIINSLLAIYDLLTYFKLIHVKNFQIFLEKINFYNSNRLSEVNRVKTRT
jgi:hypothetical protein